MQLKKEEHPIFYKFKRQKVVGKGHFNYDFLGVATDSVFKSGWDKFNLLRGQSSTPSYPPLNEHYFDWIAVLNAVWNAGEVFNMVELGAGYAPWLVRAAFASKQVGKIKSLKMMGVEADQTHFDWMRKHVIDNSLNPNDFMFIHGVVSESIGRVKFPKIMNPDTNYGASIIDNDRADEFIEVESYRLSEILDRFEGPIDLLHIDIQGAEYDVIPKNIELIKKRVKNVLVGTHYSKEKHEWLKGFFGNASWLNIFDYSYRGEYETLYGKVQFTDGLLVFVNKSLA